MRVEGRVSPDLEHSCSDELARCVRRQELLGLSVFGATIKDESRFVRVAAGRRDSTDPLSSDAIVPWRCAGKPALAIALAVLCERNHLRWSDEVAKFVDKREGSQLQSVTLRHLLTHTSGVPDWELIPDDVRGATRRPSRIFRPGEVAAYNGYTAWAILGRVVTAVDGRLLSSFIEQEVFAPLGLFTARIGTAREAGHSGVELHVLHKGDWNRAPQAIEDQNVAEWAPAIGYWGTVGDLGALYLEFLRARAGRGQLLKQPAAEAMTRSSRGLVYDCALRTRIDFGLGIMLDMRAQVQARRVSRLSFGHSGSALGCVYVVGLADPVSGLAAAVMTNGLVRSGSRIVGSVVNILQRLVIDGE